MIAKPVRLRLSRARGFDLQEHSKAVNGLPAVHVARPTPWGNPFVVGLHGTREECAQSFIAMLAGYLNVSAGEACADAQKASSRYIRAHRSTLKGKNLACWCSLPKDGEVDMCHAAVLIELVNGWKIDPRGLALERIS